MDTSDNFWAAVFARNCVFGAECRTTLPSKVENSFHTSITISITYSNISRRIIIKSAAVRIRIYHTVCNVIYGRFLIFIYYRSIPRIGEGKGVSRWSYWRAGEHQLSPLSSIIKNFFRAETKNARPYFHSVMLSVKTCCISYLLPTSLAHSLTLSNSFQLPQFSSQAEMLKCVKMRTPLDFVNGSD